MILESELKKLDAKYEKHIKKNGYKTMNQKEFDELFD